MDVKAQETRILLVVVEEPLLRLSTHILEMAGYQVMPVGESDTALTKSRKRRDETIHLLITDIRLDSHMSGARLAHLLRQDRPRVRVIYLTEYPALEALLKEAASGAATLLSKPFTPTALLEAVHKALESVPAKA